MSLIGQGAREAFKSEIISIVDKDIEFYKTHSRRDRRETEGIIDALEKLKEKIEKLDTA